jgi:hypothetical protein
LLQKKAVRYRAAFFMGAFTAVIPAKAGIQSNQATGCRIKSGMTTGLKRHAPVLGRVLQ